MVVGSCSSGGAFQSDAPGPGLSGTGIDIVDTASLSAAGDGSGTAAIPDLVLAQVRVEEALWALGALESPLLESCMAELGFTDTPPVPQRPPASAVGDILSDRYGAPQELPDGDHAYFVPVDDSSTQLAPAQHTSTEASVSAFMGDVVESRRIVDDSGDLMMTVSIGDGCLGKAHVAVFGSPRSYLDYWVTLNTVQMRSSQMLARLLTNEEFVTANGAWSRCMADAGFSFSTVLDPSNSDWDYPRPGVRERATARADLSCRASVHLTIDELGRIERELEAEYAPDLPMTLSEFAEVQDLLIRLASTSA